MFVLPSFSFPGSPPITVHAFVDFHIQATCPVHRNLLIKLDGLFMNYRSWYNKGHLGRSIAGKMHQKGHARWQGGAPFDYSDLGIISVSCPGDFWETAHDRLLPNPYLFTISERTISLDLQETQRLKQRCQIAQETIMNKNETCIIFEILTGDEKQEMRAITAGDTHRHAHTLTRSHDNIITTCVSPGCEQLHCY